jgi:hypothetical protein
MQPGIEEAFIAAGSGLLGALIGVTGTTIVGVTGFRSTRKATEATVGAAHSDRLWDRKADAYQDALAAAIWRMHQRHVFTRPDLTDDQRAEAADALFAIEAEQDWWTLQGRLGTFGAKKVVRAYNESNLANQRAHQRHYTWQAGRRGAQEMRNDSQVTEQDIVERLGKSLAAAGEAFLSAMTEAQAADERLEQAIRDDLGHKDDQAAPCSRS